MTIFLVVSVWEGIATVVGGGSNSRCLLGCKGVSEVMLGGAVEYLLAVVASWKGCLTGGIAHEGGCAVGEEP